MKNVGPPTSAVKMPMGRSAKAMSVRIIHYFMMYVFICFMLIHMYLANIEGISPTLLMFFWKEHGGLVYDPERHTIVGEDDLGHGKQA